LKTGRYGEYFGPREVSNRRRRKLCKEEIHNFGTSPIITMKEIK
jgi:hypothetical protein